MVQEPFAWELSADPNITDCACAARTSLHGRLHGKRHSAVPLCVSIGCPQIQRSHPDGSYALGLLGFVFLSLQYHFVFFDFDEPLALFLLDYVAIMGLFVCIGYYFTTMLVQKGKRKI